MTTIIAVRGDGMYSDSKCVMGNGYPNLMSPKIKRIGEYIVGGAGTCAGILNFEKWFEAGKSGKLKMKDSVALVIGKDSMTFYSEDNPDGIEISDEYYAIGSGAMAAMTALFLGKPPRRAIEVASKMDMNTGGKTQYISLGE